MSKEEREALELRLHILKGAQQEHEKVWRDFTYVYGHDHPRVTKLGDERNKITNEINQISPQLNR